MFSRGVSSAIVSTAVLLYLGCIGLVGGVTAGLFFGSGFLLLGQPSEQMHAASRVHDGNTEVKPSRPGGSSANAENGTPFGGDLPVPLTRRLAGSHHRLAERANSLGVARDLLCLEHLNRTCAPAGWPQRMPSRKSRL